jgi:hypothetical protein
MISPALTCNQCGQPEAHELGTETLCAACAHERGSCGAIAHPEDGDAAGTETSRSLESPLRTNNS